MFYNTYTYTYIYIYCIIKLYIYIYTYIYIFMFYLHAQRFSEPWAWFDPSSDLGFHFRTLKSPGCRAPLVFKCHLIHLIFIWYSFDSSDCGICVVSLWYLILVFGYFLGFQTQPARQLRWVCRCETWAEHEISTVRRMPRAEDRAQDFVIAITIRCLAGSKSRGLWSGRDQINKTNQHRLT